MPYSDPDIAVVKTRESETQWRFDLSTWTPLHKASDAYTDVDRLMLDEGYIPDRTRFVTREDGSFTLWQTYEKDPAT